MNKIELLKVVDKILGKPFVYLLTKRYQNKIPAVIRRILIIRPGGIGDAVLLLPVFKALRDRFPEVQIDVLCEKRNAGIFSLTNNKNSVYLYDKDFELIKCLRNTYDVVIDTEQWHRLSAVVAYLTGAPVRIGFDTNERSRLFTHRIPYSHDEYEVYSFLHLIEPLTGKPAHFNIDEPFIDPDNVRPVDPSLLQRIQNNKQPVAIFPGASVDERRWGGERYGEVAKELQSKGYKIIILGSIADRFDADNIKKYADGSIDLTGRTKLSDVAAILSKCRLLITADSGIMHIAYAAGTPTLSLFGSGRQKKWAPRGKIHVVLNKNLECSPCTKFGYTPRCRKNIECLSLITVEEVIKSADQILR